MTPPREITVPYDDPRLDTDEATAALLREFDLVRVTGADGTVIATIANLFPHPPAAVAPPAPFPASRCPYCGQPNPNAA